jgi:diguanylate cyclase (GGDEF)-like protein
MAALFGRILGELARLGEEITIPPDAILWKEGDPGDGVVLLLEGILEVTHESPEGDVVVLRTLEPGAILGEIAALDGHARSAAVRAYTEARVLKVPGPAFRDFVRQRADVLEELLWQQVERVRSLTIEVASTHRRARVDTLTRLYNFGFFRERLRMELDRARETRDLVGLVLFDIDHFKHYNDHNGHQEGNNALVRVAELLKASGRRGDIVARYGGEEFVGLLYGASREDARRYAEAVRAAVWGADFAGGPGQPLGRVSVSAGVACFPEDAFRADTLIEAADRNLYRAKEQGRNRVITDPVLGG